MFVCESCPFRRVPELPVGSHSRADIKAGGKCFLETETHGSHCRPASQFWYDFGFSLSCVFLLWTWSGWRDLHAALQSLAQGCTVAGQGGSASLHYLYPPFMQSEICGWEAGSFGIKNLPRANAFCLLHQLPNRCHV